jgi:antitoxin component of RelBE/YafQ-DinJ toxin-antitoxin module
MATFEDLENMKIAVIKEYGSRLHACLESMGGDVCDAILFFVKKYHNELPMPMESKIRDGIAEYAGVNPTTFQVQLTSARKIVKAIKKHESQNNTISKKQENPHVILIKKLVEKT